MQPRFFGDDDSQLYGVYHTPRGKVNRPFKAVVICPPTGQDYIRSHWCLKLLANQLTRKGVHVLRFDYAGTGDSPGSFEDVKSIETWQDNIRQAIRHIREQSKAETVMLAGLRTGAAFAAQVAQDNADVNSVVLWEPVVDGARYVGNLRNQHADMLDLWVCKMQTQNDERHEELLGSLFSRSLLDEIEDLKSAYDSIVQPQLIIKLDSVDDQFQHPEQSIQKIVSVDDENSWHDPGSLETAWLRPATTRIVVRNIDDMFKRLERFEALTHPASTEMNETPIASTGVLV
ncbi:MAG: alpha/beta hydrolase [Planctomycetota bacterium]